MSKLVVIRARNLRNDFRHFLSNFMIEIAPLTFVGRLDYALRENIIKIIQEEELEESKIIMIMEDKDNVNGFKVLCNKGSEDVFTNNFEGIILSVRRREIEDDWEIIPAKTYNNYSLINHLIDAAAFAEVFVKEFLSGQQKRIIYNKIFNVDEEEYDEKILVKLISFAAGVHDLGKATPEWQARVLNNINLSKLKYDKILDKENNIDKTVPYHHDVLGKQFFNYLDYKEYSLNEDNIIVDTMVNSDGYNDNVQNLYDFLAQMCLGHHGNNTGNTPDENNKIFRKETPAWFNEQLNIFNTIIKLTGAQELFQKTFKQQENVFMIIEGIIIVADWIVSQNDFIDQKNNTGNYQKNYNDAKEVSLNFMKEMGFLKTFWKDDLTWNNIHPHINKPNSLQETFIKIFEQSNNTIDDNNDVVESNLSGNFNVVDDKIPLFTFIHAPMGMGKTEAALYLASMIGSKNDSRGIYFCLPTQMTTNAIFDRLIDKNNVDDLGNRIFKNDYTVGLLHSKSGIHPNYQIIPNTKNISPSKTRNFLGESDFDTDVKNTQENVASQKFVSDFFGKRKLGAFNTISVGTIDQILEVSLRIKHNAMRWLALSGNVIILDEIHSFDSYTQSYILEFIQLCSELNIPVIAMTATMPKDKQKDIVKAFYKGRKLKRSEKSVVNEIINVVDKNGLSSPGILSIFDDNTYLINNNIENTNNIVNYEIKLENTNKPHNEISDSIVENVKQDLKEQVEGQEDFKIVILNTVKRCIDSYMEVKGFVKKNKIDADVYILHSRMPETMRKRITNNILNKTGKNSKRNKQIILIATQIVESSLDIDFDTLYTEIAPIDAVFQRAGRVFRHNNYNRKTSKAKIKVFVSKNVVDKDSNEKWSRPYNPWELVSTNHILQKEIESFKDNYPLKSRIAEVYKQFYKDDSNERIFSELYESVLNNDKSNIRNAHHHLIDLNKYDSLTSKTTVNSDFKPSIRQDIDSVSIVPFDSNGNIIIEDVNGVQTTVKPIVYDFKNIKIVEFYSRNSINVPRYFYENLKKNVVFNDVFNLVDNNYFPVVVNDNILKYGVDGFGIRSS